VTDSVESANVPQTDAEAAQSADQQADLKGLIVIFITLVLAAVYFISGWAPGI